MIDKVSLFAHFGYRGLSVTNATVSNKYTWCFISFFSVQTAEINTNLWLNEPRVIIGLGTE